MQYVNVKKDEVVTLSVWVKTITMYIVYTLPDYDITASKALQF